MQSPYHDTETDSIAALGIKLMSLMAVQHDTLFESLEQVHKRLDRLESALQAEPEPIATDEE